MSDLRIGVLGCGRIGRMHADLVAGRVDGLALAAVSTSLTDAGSESVADRFGGARRRHPGVADRR